MVGRTRASFWIDVVDERLAVLLGRRKIRWND